MDLLAAMPPVARAVFVLSLVAAAGLALGQVKVRGVGLGIGGVMFAGIAGGHVAHRAGLDLSPETMDFVRDFGLILFVYTIGIQVGPGFFAALRRTGLALNALALLMVGLSVAVAALLHLTLDLPLAAMLGVFSGAVTNAPALAAAQTVLREVGAPAAQLAIPGLAFAVTYPFGIAGNLLAMGLIRGVFRIDPAAEAAAFEARRQAEARALETLDVVVRNESLVGERLGGLTLLPSLHVVASRLLRDGRLSVPTGETELRHGDVLHLVGPGPSLRQARMLFGGEAAVGLTTTKGSDVKWERLVVTANGVLGASIAELNLTDTIGVVISRVNRAGIELAPAAALKLQFGDILTVIGRPEDLHAAAARLGNSERRLQTAEMVPVFIGFALGAVVGSLPLFLPGMPAPLRLGMAGGPLVVAILLARLGNLGPLVWFMPPAANLALRELGIVLFLAVLGLGSGGRFVETLAGGSGLPWMLYGVLVTMVPLVVTGLVARAVLGLDLLTICGVLAGSQTNPPGLAYANALGVSQAPALAYATVYPLAMCLRILAPQILVLMLW
ncbi:putative transporter [Magnetospirillum sp. UT-4]|uniref:putative transporter n=1 Tax=Magnetospirillum sp. UT-4 TaxID=2681467 RepID=UPI0020C23C39|nr:putative transporter [Magnetospirillum sp. UT-4]